MLLATCDSGYRLIVKHNSKGIELWDGKYAEKGDHLFEVPESCITDRRTEEEGYIAYVVDSTLDQIVYKGEVK